MVARALDETGQVVSKARAFASRPAADRSFASRAQGECPPDRVNGQIRPTLADCRVQRRRHPEDRTDRGRSTDFLWRA